LTLDVSTWTDELIAVFTGIGNTVSNSIWDPRPDAATRRKQVSKSDYIRDKYANRSFMQKENDTASIPSLLINAIHNFDIMQTHRAITAGVRLNDVSEFSRPLLFQVLGFDTLNSNAQEWPFDPLPHGRFVIAELLLQNGLEIDPPDERVVDLAAEGGLQLGLMRPLGQASLLNDHDAVHYLLRKGANSGHTVSTFSLYIKNKKLECIF
jgi:hypothetical protein